MGSWAEALGLHGRRREAIVPWRFSLSSDHPMFTEKSDPNTKRTCFADKSRAKQS